MTKMQRFKINMHLQKVILQQTTQLYTTFSRESMIPRLDSAESVTCLRQCCILFCILVKLTLCMDGVGRGTLEYFLGVLWDNIMLHLKYQAR